MSPIKDYQGPLLGNQTPQGAAFSKCPTCGNIVFDDECKYCAAQSKVAPKPLPQAQARLAMEPEPEAELAPVQFTLWVRPLGTLGVEVTLQDDGQGYYKGAGETVAMAFASAWDAYDRPLLDEATRRDFLLQLRRAEDEEDLESLVDQIARAAVARAREGQ